MVANSSQWTDGVSAYRNGSQFGYIIIFGEEFVILVTMVKWGFVNGITLNSLMEEIILN